MVRVKKGVSCIRLIKDVRPFMMETLHPIETSPRSTTVHSRNKKKDPQLMNNCYSTLEMYIIYCYTYDWFIF